MILLKEMSSEEQNHFITESIASYSQSLAAAFHLDQATAFKMAEERTQGVLKGTHPHDQQIFFNAVDQEKRVGEIWIGKHFEAGDFFYYIYIFKICEEFKYQGYFRRILKSIEKFARTEKIKRIRLNIFSQQIREFTDYQKYGFHALSTRMEKILEA